MLVLNSVKQLHVMMFVAHIIIWYSAKRNDSNKIANYFVKQANVTSSKSVSKLYYVACRVRDFSFHDFSCCKDSATIDNCICKYVSYCESIFIL